MFSLGFLSLVVFQNSPETLVLGLRAKLVHKKQSKGVENWVMMLYSYVSTATAFSSITGYNKKQPLNSALLLKAAKNKLVKKSFLCFTRQMFVLPVTVRHCSSANTNLVHNSNNGLQFPNSLCVLI